VIVDREQMPHRACASCVVRPRHVNHSHVNDPTQPPWPRTVKGRVRGCTVREVKTAREAGVLNLIVAVLDARAVKCGIRSKSWADYLINFVPVAVSTLGSTATALAAVVLCRAQHPRIIGSARVCHKPASCEYRH
jgi:hypothetical protein